MNKENATTIIAIELVTKTIQSCEQILNDKPKLVHSLKYNSKELNKSLSQSFAQLVDILQTVVDKFYWSYYEVQKFVPLSLIDLDYCVEKNKEILNAMKKLLKFVS